MSEKDRTTQSATATLLIVDDNRKLCDTLARSFGVRGYLCLISTRSLEAVAAFTEKRPSLVLLDVMLDGEDGIELLHTLHGLDRSVPIVMITGHATIQSAVESIKHGAYDYVQKPIRFEELLNIVEKALALRDLQCENDLLRSRIRGAAAPIITRNDAMLNVLEKSRRFAATEIAILLAGESGTGKELVADYIHAHSARASRDMQKINCASFPETLLDNELFGHERGAFTDARSTYRGVFERANGTSLFLDEISDMSLPIQAKILRTIQNREIRRLGGTESIIVDARFVAATNKDLDELAHIGQFRTDLLYRLNACTITIPPLRERQDDIPLLVEHFLGEFEKTSGRRVSVGERALAAVTHYSWPGNVRELRNAILYASTISIDGTINIGDLPPALGVEKSTGESGRGLERAERELIGKALREAGYNKSKAAEALGISRSTLYAKLVKYGLEVTRSLD